LAAALPPPKQKSLVEKQGFKINIALLY